MNKEASRHHSYSRLPLRIRFVLWQVSVLVPFLLTALIGQFYVLPALMGPLEIIANEVSVEVIQLKDLQVKLEIAAMPVNDYLIHGDREEVEAFAKNLQQVEQSFERVRAIRFGESEERQLVENAWQEWQAARKLADDLFSRNGIVGTPWAAQTMKHFDTRIDRAVGMLEQDYVVARDEMEEAKEKAHVARSRAVWLTVVAFVLALAVSLLVGAALASSIISGVDALRTGSAQLSAGDLSQRVVVTGVYELEELAGAYNVMAERLQSHEATLRDLATHDALTHLENRRAFETHLDEEMMRAERYDHPLALFMIDIDHFKNVNDTYGHQAGDEVLRALAAVIGEVVRPTDRAARYGGEEFVVLVPETTPEGAAALAERIRQAVAEARFNVAPGQTINVTISIGVAGFPNGTKTKKDLVAAADQALYRAKQSGRNRVCSL